MPAASAVVAVTSETMRPPTAARRRHRNELERAAGIIVLDGKVLPALGQVAGSPSSAGTAEKACRLKPCLCRKHRLIGVRMRRQRDSFAALPFKKLRAEMVQDLGL